MQHVLKVQCTSTTISVRLYSELTNVSALIIDIVMNKSVCCSFWNPYLLTHLRFEKSPYALLPPAPPRCTNVHVTPRDRNCTEGNSRGCIVTPRSRNPDKSSQSLPEVVAAHWVKAELWQCRKTCHDPWQNIHLKNPERWPTSCRAAAAQPTFADTSQLATHVTRVSCCVAACVHEARCVSCRALCGESTRATSRRSFDCIRTTG